MPRKRYKPEEIVAKLRQVDVLVSQGQSMTDAIQATTTGMELGAGSSVSVISVECVMACPRGRQNA
jgi:putative transposase